MSPGDFDGFPAEFYCGAMTNRSRLLDRLSASLVPAVVLAVVACALAPLPALAQRSQPSPFDELIGPNRDSKRPDLKAEPKAETRPDDKSADPRGPGRRGASPKDGKNAEASKEPPKPIPRSLRKPGGTNVPEGGGQRAKLLAELYAYLATATDEDVAKRTATAIEHVWQSSIGDTVNLLMERGARATKEKKGKLAIKLYEQAAALAPDNAEVFSRRALIHYAEGDVERAMGDLRRALALDPNHYRSLESLGQILKELDNKKAALEIYRRLQEVHPFFNGIKSTIDELSREIEGHGA